MNALSSPSTERDVNFYSDLKQLNEDFVKLIDATYKKSPYFDLTPTLKDYIRQFDEIDRHYPANGTKQQHQSTFASSTNKTTSLGFNFTNNIGPTQAATQIITTTTNTTTPATTCTSNPASLFSFNLPKKEATTTIAQPAGSLFSFNPTPATTTAPSTPFSFQQPQAQQQSAEDDDDAPPPEPNIEKFEEPDSKHQVRCKLYERAGSNQVTLLGFGVLFVKPLETPNKLQVVVRQDPDLRKVLLNEVISQNIPLKMLPKAVQMIVPGPGGESKFFIAKVKEEKDASQLFELLNSIKTQI